MSLATAIGISQALDGREAGEQAARQALDQTGNQPIEAALVLVSQEFSTQTVLSGVYAILGTSNIWGITTSQPIARGACWSRAVVVVLLTGASLKAQTNLWIGYGEDSQATAQLFKNEVLSVKSQPSLVLLAADWLRGNAFQFCSNLSRLSDPDPVFPVTGCLAIGDPQSGRTNVISGTQTSSGALSTMVLSGDLQVSIGSSHGWESVGILFKTTSCDEMMVKTLDGMPAAEAYSRILGHSFFEWTHLPLAGLIRLFPLGYERPNRSDLAVASPVSVDAEGTFRMNIPVEQGMMMHLLVGSPQSCIKAAQEAGRKALASLLPGKPVMALVFLDEAWQLLMEAHGHPELSTLQSILGEDIPIVGCFSLGQITHQDRTQPPELLNQSITIALLASR